MAAKRGNIWREVSRAAPVPQRRGRPEGQCQVCLRAHAKANARPNDSKNNLNCCLRTFAWFPSPPPKGTPCTKGTSQGCRFGVIAWPQLERSPEGLEGVVHQGTRAGREAPAQQVSERSQYGREGRQGNRRGRRIGGGYE